MLADSEYVVREALGEFGIRSGLGGKVEVMKLDSILSISFMSQVCLV